MQSLRIYDELTAARTRFLRVDELCEPPNAEGRGESEPVTGDNCNGQRGRALIACLEPDRRVDVSVTATKPAN